MGDCQNEDLRVGFDRHLKPKFPGARSPPTPHVRHNDAHRQSRQQTTRRFRNQPVNKVRNLGTGDANVDGKLAKR
jgi:hypothetical protein